MSLGSGLCPVRRLLQAGVNVSLGTDACGSSFSVSMLKAVNNTALVQKLRTPEHNLWITAAEAWTAGTASGAKALGMGKRLGVLEPGTIADLTGYRLPSFAFRPLNDPLRQLVYAEGGQDLALVMVDGEIIMKDGQFTRFDEPAILDEIADAYERLRPHLQRADGSVDQMRAAYEAIYRRCLAEPIAEDTHPALFHAPNAGCQGGH